MSARLMAVLPSIAWGIVAILVGRALVVYLVFGPAARVAVRLRAGAGRRCPSPGSTSCSGPGLRGAVAVAMALSLPADFPERDLLQEITFGVVLFTLLVQGTTAEWVIERVGAGRATRPAAGD